MLQQLQGICMKNTLKPFLINGLNTLLFTCLICNSPAQASWITGIGKAIKAGESAATAAKTGAVSKGAAAAVLGSELDDAARLSKIHSTPPGLPDAPPNIFLQYPWQSIQLAKCISRLEPRLGNKEANASCAAKYQKCASSIEKNPNLNTPNESCVNAVNKD
jgi:hypothetical protein